MSDPLPTVFLVDDDPAVLKGLMRLLGAAGFVVRGFASSESFLDQHDPSLPGCVVLDLAMGGLSGLELQREMAVRGWERPVVFLTGQGDIPRTVQAMKAGAVDFLTKPVDADRLVAAIRAALAGDRAARQRRIERDVVERRLAALTPREREVLRLVIAGRRNKQIAGELGTAEKTIKVHRGRIMTKMAVRSVAELVHLTGLAGVAPAGEKAASADPEGTSEP